MPKKFLQKILFSALIGVVCFVTLMPMAFAAVVQDYLAQYLLYYESEYRPPHTQEAVQQFDAIVTCLNQGGAGSENWRTGGVQETSTTAQLIQAMNSNASHPCHALHVALFNAIDAHRTDPAYRYQDEIIRTLRTEYFRGLRLPPREGAPAAAARDRDIATAAGRDAAARQKLNDYTECLVQVTAGRPNWQLNPENRITVPITQPIHLETVVNLTSSHPCHSQFAALRSHVTGTYESTVAPGVLLPVGSPDISPVSTPAAGGSAPITSGTIAPGTVYTGPGFVNITPFSTFGRISIDRIINNAINYISGFLAVIAVLSIMYGGILYMTARGDDAQVGKAKQVITLTVVGLVIASFAYLIIIFVTRIFYGA